MCCAQSLEPMPMLPAMCKAGSEELLSPDALLNTGTGKPNSPSARLHSFPPLQPAGALD